MNSTIDIYKQHNLVLDKALKGIVGLQFVNRKVIHASGRRIKYFQH